jgi:hypothetical protein
LSVEVRRALDGQVVGLGGAAGPDDLARVGVDQGGHLLAGGLDRLSASQPQAWLREAGLPKCSRNQGIMASTTRGSHGLVAP